MNGSNIAPPMGIKDPSYVSTNYFTYLTRLQSSLAPAGSDTSTFNIDGDSDFYVTKLAVHATVANDGTTYANQQLPEVNIVIVNTTTGRRYMNEAVPLAVLAGTAQLPFILPQITFFSSKSTISVSYQNASDGVTYTTLYLAFHGVKAFLRG